MAGRFLDESPRWLLQKNRSEEAKQILVKAAKCNRRSLPKDVDVVLYGITKVHIVITILHFNLKWNIFHCCTLRKQLTGNTGTNKLMVVFIKTFGHIDGNMFMNYYKFYAHTEKIT